MSDRNLEREVWHLGTWKVKRLTVKFLQEINLYEETKAGRRAVLTMTPSAIFVRCTAFDPLWATGLEKGYPLSMVYSVTSKTTDSLSLLCVITAGDGTLVVVTCRCKSTEDTVLIKKAFQLLRSGQEDSGWLATGVFDSNWTLQEKVASRKRREAAVKPVALEVRAPPPTPEICDHVVPAVESRPPKTAARMVAGSDQLRVRPHSRVTSLVQPAVPNEVAVAYWSPPAVGTTQADASFRETINVAIQTEIELSKEPELPTIEPDVPLTPPPADDRIMFKAELRFISEEVQEIGNLLKRLASISRDSSPPPQQEVAPVQTSQTKAPRRAQGRVKREAEDATDPQFISVRDCCTQTEVPQSSSQSPDLTSESDSVASIPENVSTRQFITNYDPLKTSERTHLPWADLRSASLRAMYRPVKTYGRNVYYKRGPPKKKCHHVRPTMML